MSSFFSLFNSFFILTLSYLLFIITIIITVFCIIIVDIIIDFIVFPSPCSFNGSCSVCCSKARIASREKCLILFFGSCQIDYLKCEDEKKTKNFWKYRLNFQFWKSSLQIFPYWLTDFWQGRSAVQFAASGSMFDLWQLISLLLRIMGL